MLKMAVLLSGSGRTLDNFHERIAAGMLHASISVVVSNVADALGVTKALHYGYPTFYAQTSEDINGFLARYEIDIVCLAGFLKLYTPPETLKRRVLNIHPSLIPSFCGAGFYGHHVHEAVRARGCTVSGCTVHFADENYDQGPIVLQQSVELGLADDADTIAAKVFQAECETFPRAINLIDEKGADFFWERVQQ